MCICLPEWSLRPLGQENGISLWSEVRELPHRANRDSIFLAAEFVIHSVLVETLGLLSGFSFFLLGTLPSSCWALFDHGTRALPPSQEGPGSCGWSLPYKGVNSSSYVSGKKNVQIALSERMENNPNQISFFGSFWGWDNLR